MTEVIATICRKDSCGLFAYGLTIDSFVGSDGEKPEDNEVVEDKKENLHNPLEYLLNRDICRF